MLDLPISTSPAHSPTLQRLVENLAMINVRLDNAGAWKAADVGDQYIRVEADDSLVTAGPPRRDMQSLCMCFPDPCAVISTITAGRSRSTRLARDCPTGPLCMRCLGSTGSNPVS